MTNKETLTAEWIAEYLFKVAAGEEKGTWGNFRLEALDLINQHTSSLQSQLTEAKQELVNQQLHYNSCLEKLKTDKDKEIERLKGIIEFAHKELHTYLNNYSTMEEINESSWAVPIYTRLGTGLGNIGCGQKAQVVMLYESIEEHILDCLERVDDSKSPYLSAAIQICRDALTATTEQVSSYRASLLAQGRAQGIRDCIEAIEKHPYGHLIDAELFEALQSLQNQGGV